jgi:hypothetical protein
MGFQIAMDQMDLGMTDILMACAHTPSCR